jgi:uncharacterized protein (UPF0212 family)
MIDSCASLRDGSGPKGAQSRLVRSNLLELNHVSSCVGVNHCQKHCRHAYSPCSSTFVSYNLAFVQFVLNIDVVDMHFN